MMRPTLHEYNLQKLSDLDCTAISDVLNFTKLTNRAPKLGDFVPCDEDGNVLDEPKNYDKWLSEDYYTEVETTWIRNCSTYQAARSRTIFKGDWEVRSNFNGSVEVYNNENNCAVLFRKEGDVFANNKPITRIEDLPREIEFIDGLI